MVPNSTLSIAKNLPALVAVSNLNYVILKSYEISLGLQ